MTHTALPLPTAADLRAIALAMRGWLFAFAAWLLEAFGAESAIGRTLKLSLRAELRGARQEVQELVGLLALRVVRPQRGTRARASFSTTPPRGFRPAGRPSSARRRCMRGVFPRGAFWAARTLRARITLLLDTLRRLDRAVTRFLTRIVRGPHGAEIIAVAPRTAVLAGRIITLVGDDTS